MFQDGDLDFAIRDLVDLVDLCDHFGASLSFWKSLATRAGEHDLQRPLYYALRYGRELLNLQVPDTVMQTVSAAAPPIGIVTKFMDTVIPRVLLPDDPDRPSRLRARAAAVLYLRSHWLRMPPWLLTAHLIRKGIMQAAASVSRWYESRQQVTET